MSTLYDALAALASAQDAELLDGFRRYEAVLANILTQEQLASYAAELQRTGEIRIFEEMTPAELADLAPDTHAIATAVRADENVSMENRRVVALLNQRGEQRIAPDLHGPRIATGVH